MKLANILGWILAFVFAMLYVWPDDVTIDQESSRRLREAVKVATQAKINYEQKADSVERRSAFLFDSLVKASESEEQSIKSSHEKFITNNIVDASIDSLLLTGKALSDSIRDEGYFSNDSY